MTGKELGQLCSVLSAMPPNGWTQGHAEFYGMVLGRMDYGQVTAALSRMMTKTTFRPQPAEILAEMASMSGANPDDVYQRLVQLRAKYGEEGHRVAHPGGGCHYEPGEPGELTDVEAATVRRLGGWLNWCRSNSPDGVERRQCGDAARSVLSEHIADAVVGPARPALSGRILKQIDGGDE